MRDCASTFPVAARARAVYERLEVSPGGGVGYGRQKGLISGGGPEAMAAQQQQREGAMGQKAALERQMAEKVILFYFSSSLRLFVSHISSNFVLSLS